MIKQGLTYEDCRRLDGAEATYTVAEGRELLEVGPELFLMGCSFLDKSLKKSAALFGKRGLQIGGTTDGEYKGKLSLIYPPSLQTEHAYILAMAAQDGTKILLSTGFIPLPWPETVTKDMGEIDYFQARMMHDKSAVYHYQNGRCRLSCEGEIWDCGVYDYGRLNSSSYNVTWSDQDPGNSQMAGSIVGKLALKSSGDRYTLVLLGFEGSIAVIFTGDLMQELDALGEGKSK